MPDKKFGDFDDDFNNSFNDDFGDDDFLNDDWSKYEGVEFIRSNELDEFDDEDETNEPEEKPKKKKAKESRKDEPKEPRERKKVKGKSQFPAFMITTVGLGAVVCLFAFAIMFSMTKPKTPPANGMDQNLADAENQIDLDVAQSSENDKEMNALVFAINNKELTIRDIITDVEYIVYVDGKTAISDKYGTPMTLNQIFLGDLIRAEFNTVNGKAKAIQISPSAWEKKSITGAKIEGDKIRVGSELFKIPKNTIILPLGTNAKISDITTGDTLTLKGYGETAYTFVFEKRNGLIKVINYNNIVDGAIEIDNKIYKAIDDAGEIPVSEGLHTIVVSGDNIDTFTRSISVKPGETSVIDLKDVQAKTGIVALRVNETGYRLFINDTEEVNTSEPLTLNYGAYKLRVAKEGFETWEGTLAVDRPTITLNVNLVKQVQMGNITVTSSPDGGSVYIDNAYIGIAPVKTKVEYGEHRLTVNLEGYDESAVTIMVDADNRAYNIILRERTAGSAQNNIQNNTQPEIPATYPQTQTNYNQTIPSGNVEGDVPLIP